MELIFLLNVSLSVGICVLAQNRPTSMSETDCWCEHASSRWEKNFDKLWHSAVNWVTEKKSVKWYFIELVIAHGYGLWCIKLCNSCLPEGEQKMEAIDRLKYLERLHGLILVSDTYYEWKFSSYLIEIFKPNVTTQVNSYC